MITIRRAGCDTPADDFGYPGVVLIDCEAAYLMGEHIRLFHRDGTWLGSLGFDSEETARSVFEKLPKQPFRKWDECEVVMDRGEILRFDGGDIIIRWGRKEGGDELHDDTDPR